ncbi:MAG TPA: hypothetical protein PLO57_01995, partial [Candidatus Cloacimonadota bacterium]|nr:hypothetical protein [Candidatus Cloacimonadota bacterium]
ELRGLRGFRGLKNNTIITMGAQTPRKKNYPAPISNLIFCFRTELSGGKKISLEVTRNDL